MRFENRQKSKFEKKVDLDMQHKHQCLHNKDCFCVFHFQFYLLLHLTFVKWQKNFPLASACINMIQLRFTQFWFGNKSAK